MATITLRRQPFYYNARQKQTGVVLVVSLVFLIALTAVAAALMQNTTSDIKMSGASQDKVVATEDAYTCNDEVIYKSVSKQIGGRNVFANSPLAFNAADPSVAIAGCDAVTESQADITLENPDRLELDCSHSRSPSSVQIFTCNRLRVDVNTTYGRNNQSSIVAVSTVEQQLLRN